MDEKIIEKVIAFISSLRASGHDIVTEETLLKVLGVVELPPSDQATLFRALESSGGFRPDNGHCWCFQDFNFSALQEAANIKPSVESTVLDVTEETPETIDPSTFKLNGTWIVTTDSNGKRHHHFQRDKPLVHSNDKEDKDGLVVRQVRGDGNGESHLDFDLYNR